MARPREFDEAVVLDRARDLLWANGITATSINELSAAMQLSVGSIYKAFGSKDALVARVLDEYLTASRAEMADALDAGATGREGFDRLLAMVTTMATGLPADDTETPDGAPANGCFAVNCSVERAAVTPEVAERLRHHDDSILALLAAGIARVAEEEGRALDPEGGAALLYTAINGLQVAARKGIARDEATRILTTARDAVIGT